jgi:hypothetical protein
VAWGLGSGLCVVQETVRQLGASMMTFPGPSERGPVVLWIECYPD